jgi:DNA repair protein RecN (Recombination protein N)
VIEGLGTGFDDWRARVQALQRTRLDDREKQARIEIASFQVQEIEKTSPRAGEDETLGSERALLANADRVKRLTSEAYAALYDGPQAALAGLATVWKRVADLGDLDARFRSHLDARDSIKPQLEDLAFLLRSYASDLDAAPERLQQVEDRLAALDRLKRKYGPTLDDVLARHRALRDELAALDATVDRVAALEQDERTARATFLDRARQVSMTRQAAAVRLARALQAALADLAMPTCRVEIRCATSDRPADWSRAGIDAVEFFFSPNPGEDLRALARIASGGELSRVMLALKTVADTGESGRTLIFDEVDDGIGGVAAMAVGSRLRALGRRAQVISVTHLPQVAAQADVHFQVAKRVAGGRTLTALTRLDAAGRELEIGRMIAGAAVTDAVRSSARDLMAAAGESESEVTTKAKPLARKAKGKSGAA